MTETWNAAQSAVEQLASASSELHVAKFIKTGLASPFVQGATHFEGSSRLPQLEDLTPPSSFLFRQGSTQADDLRGGKRADWIRGAAGNDQIRGQRGDDVIMGEDGNDSLWGDRGNDQLSGGDGDDRLSGGRGDDQLLGGDGDDELRGDRGNDTLVGGEGNDSLNGGRGHDIFVIGRQSGTDTIQDFRDGQDKIRLEGGLSFADLVIEQGTGEQRRAVLLRDRQTNEVVAILRRVNVSQLDRTDFLSATPSPLPQPEPVPPAPEPVPPVPEPVPPAPEPEPVPPVPEPVPPAPVPEPVPPAPVPEPVPPVPEPIPPAPEPVPPAPEPVPPAPVPEPVPPAPVPEPVPPVPEPIPPAPEPVPPAPAPVPPVPEPVPPAPAPAPIPPQPSPLPTPASPNDPRIVQTYMVRPDVLAVQIDTGRVIRGQQVPYVAQPGDRTWPSGTATWVERDGQMIGSLVGANQDILFTFDQYSGIELDTAIVDQMAGYRVQSSTDPEYQTAQTPEAIARKTKPTDMARLGPWQFEWPLTHTIYLDLRESLDLGATYQITLPGTNLGVFNFTYVPEQIRSESVQVSQLGFRPDDPAKVAFLSTWMGTGGGLQYREGMTFWLVDDRTNQRVFQGQTQLSKAANAAEDPYGRNYNGTDVYMMDFSSFQTAGRYRVYVEGIGSSFTFEIGENTWQQAFSVSARGLYHQRSGIALESPYTDYQRPRGFHPDDGIVVYQSGAKLMDTDMGIGQQSAFEALLSTRTDEVVSDAWGGYFDAGDWDRRIQHLDAPRSLFELMELFPSYFNQLTLNLPESSNALPDVIDEALWSLDFFRRLQTTDGGIRGGIESAEHPKTGETSWQESHVLMAYAPDMWSSYIYAGVAARAAHVLQNYAPDLAATYRDSALRAMEYAEREFGQANPAQIATTIKDERNLAAVELYRLTGENRWHDLFLQTTAFTDANREVYEWQNHEQRNAAFVYARIDRPDVRSDVQANAQNAFLREANQQVTFGQNTAYKWTKNNPWEPIGWGTGPSSPKATTLLRAHALTGDENYLEAGVLSTQFAAGANPLNLVYTTGLGQRSPQNPLIMDQRITGQAPPPGITVYGPIDLQQFYGNYWAASEFLANQMSPNPWTTPTFEGYTDIYLSPAQTEFTIHQTMVPTVYTWGYLAARASIEQASPSFS